MGALTKYNDEYKQAQRERIIELEKERNEAVKQMSEWAEKCGYLQADKDALWRENAELKAGLDAAIKSLSEWSRKAGYMQSAADHANKRYDELREAADALCRNLSHEVHSLETMRMVETLRDLLTKEL